MIGLVLLDFLWENGQDFVFEALNLIRFGAFHSVIRKISCARDQDIVCENFLNRVLMVINKSGLWSEQYCSRRNYG